MKFKLACSDDEAQEIWIELDQLGFKDIVPRTEFDALHAWCTTFHPYQREWLLDPSLFSICCKSRQIGISHATAGVGTLWGAYLGEPTTFLSKGDKEAVEVLDKAKLHARVLQDFGSKFASMNGTNNQHEVHFASGGLIRALPSTSGHGFTGNVFFDEFAHVKKPDALWDAALPTMMLGNFKARVVSTPNGATNKFYQLWSYARGLVERPKEFAHLPEIPWRTHFITLKHAIAAGYPVDLAKCQTIAGNDPRMWDQNFNCIFLDAMMQYLPTALIEGSASNDGFPETGEHYGGLDIGKEVDLSVLTILRVVGIKRYLAWVAVIKRTDPDALDALVDWAFAVFKLRRLQIDKNGLGEFPAARIKKRYSEVHDPKGRRPRVVLNNFQLKDKEELATALYGAMAAHVLVLPMHDLVPAIWIDHEKREQPANPPGYMKILNRELAQIQRIVTPSANVRYASPKTPEGHGDHAWSLALANHAVDEVHPVIAALQARMSQGSS